MKNIFSYYHHIFDKYWTQNLLRTCDFPQFRYQKYLYSAIKFEKLKKNPNVELEMCTRKTRFKLFLTFSLFGSNFVQQRWNLLPSVISEFNLTFVILLLWILSGNFNCRFGICRKKQFYMKRILKPEKILDMNQKGKNRIGISRIKWNLNWSIFVPKTLDILFYKILIIKRAQKNIMSLL